MFLLRSDSASPSPFLPVKSFNPAPVPVVPGRSSTVLDLLRFRFQSLQGSQDPVVGHDTVPSRTGPTPRTRLSYRHDFGSQTRPVASFKDPSFPPAVSKVKVLELHLSGSVRTVRPGPVRTDPVCGRSGRRHPVSKRSLPSNKSLSKSRDRMTVKPDLLRNTTPHLYRIRNIP